ncbi:hypothetical protein HDU76_002162 [Blyttiomyces sp. JEL0837]|nr:hypothetical protein HDU76_002162 [Blyttiomyces sp. JEL0837]
MKAASKSLMTLPSIIKTMQSHADPSRAKSQAKYLQSVSKEGYGYPDKFLGLSVPTVRSLNTQFGPLPLTTHLTPLLKSEYHEIRFMALVNLKAQVEKTIRNNNNPDQLENKQFRQDSFDLYMNLLHHHRTSINNWNLVDDSAPYIIGGYLYHDCTRSQQKTHLTDMISGTQSHLWTQRVAILSQMKFFIKQNHDFEYTLWMAEYFIEKSGNDDGEVVHDLIQKAVGWMLREVGNNDEGVLVGFLDRFADVMPRTMLRYAIEKLDKHVRVKYMNMKKK